MFASSIATCVFTLGVVEQFADLVVVQAGYRNCKAQQVALFFFHCY